MPETVKLVAVGFAMLVMGVFFLTKRDSWSRQMAEQTKEYKWSEWFKFNYCEEYFRLLYASGGVFCSLAGVFLILKAIGDVQQGIWKEISNAVMILLVIVAFGGGLILIIYSNLKFSRIWKGNRK